MLELTTRTGETVGYVRVDDLTYEMASVVLGVPVGTVYSRLHSARKSFQKALARMQARETREEAWLR